MMSLLLSLLTSQAMAATCDAGQVLADPKSDCAKEFVNNIKDEQDRSEAKHLLTSWKMPKDVEVRIEGGLMEAIKNEKVIFRAMWMKFEKPAILFLDGKILVDNSGNPSVGRRLDNLMRKNKSAAFSLFNEAHAQTNSDLTRNLMFFYSLGGTGFAGSALETLREDKNNELGKHFPAQNVLVNAIFGKPQIKCAGNNLTGPTRFQWGTTGADLDVTIIPKSQNEFIIKDIGKNKYSLLKLGDYSAPFTGQPTLDPRSIGWNAKLSACADENCSSLSKEWPLKDWNLVLKQNPEQDQQGRKTRIKTNDEAFQFETAKIRKALLNHVFGLSIAGACCSDATCRQVMLDKYKIQLQPAAGESTTTQ